MCPNISRQHITVDTIRVDAFELVISFVYTIWFASPRFCLIYAYKSQQYTTARLSLPPSTPFVPALLLMLSISEHGTDGSVADRAIGGGWRDSCHCAKKGRGQAEDGGTCEGVGVQGSVGWDEKGDNVRVADGVHLKAYRFRVVSYVRGAGESPKYAMLKQWIKYVNVRIFCGQAGG